MVDKISDLDKQELLKNPILLQLKSLLFSDFFNVMVDMNQSMDVLFFEIAQTLPNSEQRVYLDLMLVIKKNRASIENNFKAALNLAYLNMINLEPIDPMEMTLDRVDVSSLRLINTEDMEVSVCIETIVAKTRLDIVGELTLLKRRVSSLLPGIYISEKNLFLDPFVVTHAYKDAIQCLDLATKEKVILLKNFKNLFLSHFSDWADKSNKFLIELGVLPDLKLSYNDDVIVKNKANKTKESTINKNTTHGTESFFNLLNQFSNTAFSGAPFAANQFVSSARFQNGEYLGGGGIGSLSAEQLGGSIASVPLVPTNVHASASVASLSTDDLVERLSQVQKVTPQEPLSEYRELVEVENVRRNIVGSFRSDSDIVEALKPNEEVIINFVSLLFDFILDDQNLPETMKVLLSRLQIPLIKVALLDQIFFTDAHHPARLLLNELAKAGVGWTKSSQDGDVMYHKIEEVVLTVIKDFRDDLSLFSNLLKNFEEFSEVQKSREKIVHKRILEAEEGKARSEFARSMVNQTLYRYLKGKTIALQVVQFLQDGWSKVLYIHALKEGVEAASWKQSVKFVDALIWCVTAQYDNDWQTKVKELFPKLINSMKKGLLGAGLDGIIVDSYIKEISEVYQKSLEGLESQLVNVVEESEQVNTRHALRMSDVSNKNSNAVDTVIIPALHSEEALEGALPPDHQDVIRVSRLTIGSWIEFIKDNIEREKLVARIKTVDKFIFANRRGIKTSEISGSKLAIEIHQGRARVVDESVFFDRALESVIGNLRTIK
jgi:hypothetical protein